MEAKRTLRALLADVTSYREDGYGSQLWLPLTDLLLDYPIAEDVRYERQLAE